MKLTNFDQEHLRQIIDTTYATVNELESIKRSPTYRVARRLRRTFPGRVAARVWKIAFSLPQVYRRFLDQFNVAKRVGSSFAYQKLPVLSTKLTAFVRPVPNLHTRLRIVGRNPNSQGSEMWVLAAKNKDGFIPFDSMNIYGSWSIREGLGYRGRTALVCTGNGWIDIPHTDDSRVMLLRHPWSGIVEAYSNGHSRVFDLYRSHADSLIISLSDFEIRESLPATKPYLNMYLSRDISYANTAVAIVNPEWRGVYSSTRNLFDHVLEIPDNLNEESGLYYARMIAEHRIPVIVIQGFPLTYYHLVVSLRRLAPKMRIAVLWHGSFLQNIYDYDARSFLMVKRLYDDKIVWKVGFVKPGMEEIMERLGVRSGLVRNFVKSVPENPSSPLPGGPHFGLWFLRPDLRKNQGTMIAATSVFPSAQIHISGVSERIEEFIELMGIKANIFRDPIDYQQMSFYLSGMHLNLYVTLSECAPMLPLESLSVGVPCLIGPSAYYFDDHDFLRTRLVVPKPDDAALISKYIQRALEERSEIISAYIRFVPDYNRLAMESLMSFVELDIFHKEG